MILNLALDREIVQYGQAIEYRGELRYEHVHSMNLFVIRMDIPLRPLRTSHDKAALPPAASSFSKVKAKRYLGEYDTTRSACEAVTEPRRLE